MYNQLSPHEEKVGLEELAKLYQSLGQNPSEQALKIAFKQMDVGNQGAVSL